MRTQNNKARKRERRGVNRNANLLDDDTRKSSFVNNLPPSPAAWIRPANLTLLGPLRSWEYPKIFRSSKVKKDIPAITRIKATNEGINFIICKVFILKILRFIREINLGLEFLGKGL